MRTEKIACTIINVYDGGIYCIRIDENVNTFEKGEELIVKYDQFVVIRDKEWDILMKKNNDCSVSQINNKFMPSKKKINNKYRKRKK